jgi:hypothetical protein
MVAEVHTSHRLPFGPLRKFAVVALSLAESVSRFTRFKSAHKSAALW